MPMLGPRDDLPPGWVREGDYITPWWHSKTGVIVRWVVFLVAFVAIMAFVLGGYYHAKSRIRRGLPPLAYHRWLVGRQARRAGYDDTWPAPDNRNQPHPNSGYAMNDMPPPVYDPSRPPAYSGPPQGGSKADPWQWRGQPTVREPESNPAPVYEAEAAPTTATATSTGHAR